MISTQQVRIKRLNPVEMKFKLNLKCIMGKVEVHGIVVLSVAMRSRGVNVRNRNTGGSFSPNQAGRFVPREGNRNPIGRDGRPTQCHSCGSIYHWLPQSPNSSENKKPVTKEVHNSYLTEQVEQCFLEQEVSEALNCAVVDSGCASNVVGINWLHCYLDTLPRNITLQERQSGKTFRFGLSKSYPSLNPLRAAVEKSRQCRTSSTNGRQENSTEKYQSVS